MIQHDGIWFIGKSPPPPEVLSTHTLSSEMIQSKPKAPFQNQLSDCLPYPNIAPVLVPRAPTQQYRKAKENIRTKSRKQSQLKPAQFQTMKKAST